MKHETAQQNIPSGWKLKKLNDVLNYERPDAYIVKSTSYSNKAKTPVLTANKSFVLGYTDEDFGVYKNVPAIIFDDFTTDSKFVDFPFKIKSSAIKILKEKNENIDLRFVFEKMKSVNFPTGSHKRFYISQYQNLEIALPSISEQQKIAKILGEVDEVIAKTQGVIDVTEKLKRGMMQQLFSRGIGHTKFKETKIGQIPEEWNLATLGQIRKFITSGSRSWSKYYSEQGAPFIRVSNLAKSSIVLDLQDMKYVIVPDSAESIRTKVQEGDILISITADLGRIGLVQTGSDAYVSQHVAIVRINQDTILPSYLAEFLRTDVARKQFLSSNEGGTKLGLSLPTVEKTLIPVPQKGEQGRIAEILSAVEEKISVNKKLKEKLTLLKKGLMQDLLSGKKRV